MQAKLTTRNGLPTKAAIYKLVALAGTRINSLDNRTAIDSIAWQHHDIDKINKVIDYLRAGGFTVTDINPYKPKELRCGFFNIKKKGIAHAIKKRLINRVGHRGVFGLTGRSIGAVILVSNSR